MYAAPRLKSGATCLILLASQQPIDSRAAWCYDEASPGDNQDGSVARLLGEYAHKVDLERHSTYVLLTNRTYHGREPGPEGIVALHTACARAVVHALDQGE